MKVNLATRLFLSFLAVLLISAVILVLVARFELPRAYGRHLGMMEGMMPGGMGPGSGRNTETVESGTTLFEGFRSSFNDALLLAGAVALVTALLASLLVSRWMLVPLQRMTLASQRIAAGKYTERVPGTHAGDEIGTLAANFNRMAESLEKVEGRRKRLIADVAHELRTPLTTIKGSIEGLLDGMLPASEHTFTQISQEADRLNRLIDDLQELSRVESGTFVLDRKEVRLAELSISMKKRFDLQ
jgi:histidine kinase